MTSRRRSLSPTSGISTASLSTPRIVNKLALEGKSKSNGASIKLYMKFCIPLDSISPGSPIPLFSEESLKIVDSIVHPIDTHNVPYAFSNSSLLQASRALNLPNRSSRSYLSLFPHLGMDKALDERLTGHISIVDFQVTYVLPKEIPNLDEQMTLPSKSLGTLNFIAALDMVIPFRSIPPLSPFTLSIPIPRCLQNTVKLQILPPTPGIWDASTTPTVSPRPPSSPKSVSSSVSSLISDTNDDLVVQGSFPSANEFVVRFALRDDNDSELSSGRRKVSIGSTAIQSEWLIVERQPDRIRARLAASIKFKGIWYAGVATTLGLEVAFQGRDSLVTWGSSGESSWDIHGTLGYTGYSNVQEPTAGPFSHTKSAAPCDKTTERPASPLRLGLESLLRVPLPQSIDLPDYSFESNSQDGTPLVTPTTSDAPTSIAGSLFSHELANGAPYTPQPCTPFLLHLEMSDIRLSASSNLECQIYGTVVVHADASGRIVLPKFTFSRSTEHRGELLLRSEVDGLVWYTERALDPIPLMKGVSHRCPENTVLILPKSQKGPVASPVISTSAPTPVPKEQTQIRRVKSTSKTIAFIPEVHVGVTPLFSTFPVNLEKKVAIKLRLTCPSYSSNPPRMLEFGLASPSEMRTPNIQIVSCTVGNLVVDAELYPRSSESGSLENPGESSEWACWIGIPLGEQNISDKWNASNSFIELLYLVSFTDGEASRTFWSRYFQKTCLIPLLPCFPAKVGRLEVEVEETVGWSFKIQETNLSVLSSSNRALAYTLQPFFFPSARLVASSRPNTLRYIWLERLFFAFLGALFFAAITHLNPRTLLITAHTPALVLAPAFTPAPSSFTPVPSSYNYFPPNLPRENRDDQVVNAILVTTASSYLPLDSQRTAHSVQTDRSGEIEQKTTKISDTSLQIRAQAFASFTTLRLRQLYDTRVDATVKSLRRGLSRTWEWYSAVWHWPLPP